MRASANLEARKRYAARTGTILEETFTLEIPFKRMTEAQREGILEHLPFPDAPGEAINLEFWCTTSFDVSPARRRNDEGRFRLDPIPVTGEEWVACARAFAAGLMARRAQAIALLEDLEAERSDSKPVERSWSNEGARMSSAWGSWFGRFLRMRWGTKR